MAATATAFIQPLKRDLIPPFNFLGSNKCFSSMQLPVVYVNLVCWYHTYTLLGFLWALLKIQLLPTISFPYIIQGFICGRCLVGTIDLHAKRYTLPTWLLVQTISSVTRQCRNLKNNALGAYKMAPVTSNWRCLHSSALSTLQAGYVAHYINHYDNNTHISSAYSLSMYDY